MFRVAVLVGLLVASTVAATVIPTQESGVPAADQRVTDHMPMQVDPWQHLDTVRQWQAFAPAPLPENRSVVEIGLLLFDPALGQALYDAAGPALATTIAEIRAMQLAGQDPAQTALQIAAWVPGMQKIAAGLEPFPAELGDELCPLTQGPVYNPGIAGAGSYGSAGVCILGTDDDAYSVPDGACFGHSGGMAIELGGNDVYETARWCHGATGGIFIDIGGDDQYLGRVFGPGSVSFGAAGGIFIDGSGHDLYEVGLSSLGDAGGTFVDMGGDDVFDAFPNVGAPAMGTRGGLFVDLSGDDAYKLSSSKGVGHAGGTFLELGGHDKYELQSSGSIAISGGLLLDAWGDDSYTCNDHCFGSINHVFIDGAGNDEYWSGSNSFGRGPPTQGSPLGGVFMDIGGDDEYTTTGIPGVNGNINIGAVAALNAQTGLFLDSEDPASGRPHNGVLRWGDTERAINQASPITEQFPEFQATALQTTEVMGPGTLHVDLQVDLPMHAKLAVFDDLGTHLPVTGGLTLAPDVFAPGTHTLSFDYQATTAGDRTLIVRFEDPLGLYEFGKIRFFTVTVDLSPPIVVLRLDDGSGLPGFNQWGEYHSEDLTVQITASDAQAGIWRVYGKVGSMPDPAVDSPLQTFTIASTGRGPSNPSSVVFDLPTLSDGTHRVFVLVEDAVGNQRSIQRDVRIDQTGPLASLSLNGTQSGGWFTTAPTVEISAQDALAGLGKIQLKWAGASGTGEESIAAPPTNPYAATLAGPTWSDGITGLTLTVDDAAHAPNCLLADREVRIDREPPTSSHNGDQWEGTTQPLTLDLNATDAHSGVAAIQARTTSPDGTVSPWVQADQVVLDAPGTWSLEMFATDIAGNIEDPHVSQIFAASQDPIAAFRASVTDTDRLATIQFTDLSHDPDGTITTWSWDFGDGVASSTANPAHRFADLGSYPVRLTVEDNHGQQASATHWIDVHNIAPRSDFFVRPATPSIVDQAEMQSTATDPDGLITGWLWEFQDGTTWTGARATHQFETPGDHLVTLTVTDNDGTQHQSAQIITVDDRPTPEAAFTASATSTTKLEAITFTDASYPRAGAIIDWHWDFGGLGSSTQTSPTFTFPEVGLHEVVLRVTDDGGAIGEARQSITINPVAPGVTIHGPSEALSLEGIQWTAQAHDPDGIVESLQWFVNNEPAGTGPSLIQHYLPGAYQIRLVATDDDGQTAVARHRIDVADRPPTLHVQIPESIHKGDVIELFAAAEDPEGLPVRLLWTIGQDTYQANPIQVSFATIGDHGIEVVATDPAGTSAVWAGTATVVPLPPFVVAPDPVTIWTLQGVRMRGLAHDPDGDIATWAWDFGDGTTSNISVPTHAYAHPGTYTVTLQVTDDDGGIASDTTTVTVRNREPTLDIVAAPSGGLTGDIIQFSATAVDPEGPVEITWDFGDGASGLGDSIEHTFVDNGQYQVTAKATDADGAVVAQTRIVAIQNRPPAARLMDMVLTETTFTPKLEAQDVDGQIVSWEWELDGQRAVGATPTLDRPLANTTLTVSVTDDDGATASASANITVMHVPIDEPVTPGPSNNEAEDVQDLDASNAAHKESPSPSFWVLLCALSALAALRRKPSK